MTEAAVIFAWLGQFGMPVYARGCVPDDAAYPYLVCDLSVGGWNEGEQTQTVDLYDYTTSAAAANAEAREVVAGLGLGGVYLPCDGGAVWLKRGSPAWLAMDQGDGVRQRRINITAEFETY